MSGEVKLKCILHFGAGCDTGALKQISEDIWEKIRLASVARSGKSRKSKYDEIISSLPSDILPGHGYHPPCYSNFTAIPKQVTKQKKSETTVSTRSQMASNSQGILCRKSVYSVAECTRKLMVLGNR